MEWFIFIWTSSNSSLLYPALHPMISQVYWYVNYKFLSAVNPQQKIFFNPASSNIKISCTDDKGRNTNIEIKVKFD